jgi:ABC-type branched-subunit amino acid transport system substrate-binding protein
MFFSSLRALVNTNVKHGITGNIEFNEKGDRIESLYEIINIQYGQAKVIGTYRSNTVSEHDHFLCFSDKKD